MFLTLPARANTFVPLDFSVPIDLNFSTPPSFKIKGKFLSPTHKKRIYDVNNSLLYTVRDKYFTFFNHSSLVFNAEGEKIARVKNKFFSFKDNFIIEGYKDEIKIERTGWLSPSKIERNGEVIGTITKQITIATDCYELDANEQDISFLVALVIAIDNIQDNKKRKRD